MNPARLPIPPLRQSAKTQYIRHFSISKGTSAKESELLYGKCTAKPKFLAHASIFLAKHKGDAGSGKKEPYIATSLRMKMKKKEEITDAELKTIGHAAGIFSTILGVSIVSCVVVFVVVPFVVSAVPLLVIFLSMLN
ncbi:MAG: hypothetical protein VX694_12830 [Planctomycetota bacterium]|nr:hypothetical protein [Planctomycetota bacterium]